MKTRASAPLWLLFVLALFFASGACGLLYQVTWTRQLVLLFGTTSHAVSTVLCVFFLGLGLGGLWGGRLADRAEAPLRWYGIFEIAIGAWAIFFLAAVQGGEDLVVAVLRAVEGSRGAGIALRVVLAGVLLLPPVFLMGATLPLLAKTVERAAVTLGRRTGVLYGVNTLGAVIGCFVTGFHLIAAYGYTRTTLLGAAINVLAGLAALLLQTRLTPLDASLRAVPAAPPIQSTRAGSGRAVLAVFALTGFCGLALEVVWTRLLAIVFLGTTYAYTTMLGTLLCGLALGGFAGALLVGRMRAPRLGLGVIVAIYGILVLWFIGRLPGLPAAYIAMQAEAGGDWDQVLWGIVWQCFWVLLPPSFAAGMVFPVAVNLLSQAYASLGRDLGRLYAVNTFGGVAGAVLGGFVLLPLLGTHGSLVGLAVILVAAGLLLGLSDAQATARARLLRGGALLAVALVLFLRLPGDVNAALNVGYVPENHRVLSVREGVEGTVVVSEPEDSVDGADRVLWINRVQATTSIERGVKMNRFQGALPLLFDRDPKQVLFMCFGSGITCGTLALSPFERIDAVEISPDVISSAPLFAKDNLGVLDRPNLRVHIDDGRNHLLTTHAHYDLITFEPMPLALAGVSNFYTQDYYRLCLARLNPGGLVSQWVPLHSLSTEVVRSLVHTFSSVFPEYTAWFVNADLFLIGSDQPLHIDYARLREKLAVPALQDALAAVGYHDHASLTASFLLDKAGVDAFAAGARIMTDDRPWAEFEAPRLVNAREVPNSLAALAPLVVSPLPLVQGADEAERAVLERRHRSRAHDLVGLQEYYGGMAVGKGPAEAFKASLDIDPANSVAQYYLRQITLALGDRMIRWEEFEDAHALIDDALRYLPGDPAIAVLRARLDEAEAP